MKLLCKKTATKSVILNIIRTSVHALIEMGKNSGNGHLYDFVVNKFVKHMTWLVTWFEFKLSFIISSISSIKLRQNYQYLPRSFMLPLGSHLSIHIKRLWTDEQVSYFVYFPALCQATNFLGYFHHLSISNLFHMFQV